MTLGVKVLDGTNAGAVVGANAVEGLNSVVDTFISGTGVVIAGLAAYPYLKSGAAVLAGLLSENGLTAAFMGIPVFIFP